MCARYGLATWFVSISTARTLALVITGSFAVDARIYVAGARNWLAGLNPWDASIAVDGHVLHFAAPPPNLIPVVPFALLPADAGVVALVLLSACSAVVLVRTLRLPVWWLAFPPVAEGVLSGNPQMMVAALLVIGGSASVFSALLKAYALIPLVLLGRYRRAAEAAVVLGIASVLTIPLWGVYLSDFMAISARLARESAGGYSAWAQPWMIPPTILAIIVLLWLDRPRGGWLAIPALWPSSELHYTTLYMPVADRWLPWLFAIVAAGVPPLGTIVLALTAVARRVKGMPRLPTIAYDPEQAAELSGDRFERARSSNP